MPMVAGDDDGLVAELGGARNRNWAVGDGRMLLCTVQSGITLRSR